MNQLEVEQIMEFVEEQAPFVVLSGATQVMDGRRLKPEKLLAVLLTEKRFRDNGQRTHIAVEVVATVYVRARHTR